MKVLLVIGTILVVTQAVTFPELVKQEWRLFKAQHRKMYSSPSEEQARLRIYMENRNMIAEHNERYAKGEVTYMLQMNQFGDLSHGEFLSIMGLVNQTRLHPEIKGETYMSPTDARSPTEVDWRKNGVVTPVKDQGDCGSCWSFSAAGAIEAQHFFKTGRLVSLSEQNLIDCSRPFGTNGCGGGWMDLAFSYVIFNGGIDTEESYPYEARNGYCRYKTQNRGATISSYVSIQAGNETLLKEAVANVGPIAVTLDASHSSFQFYSNGIYYEPSCSVTTPTHAVLVVGYGAEGNSDYWLVKNSYGTTWGTEGYFKIARNRDNHCGIGSHASYPIV